jgi:eukaryotic-like serine/threonine-protein kinase
VSVVDGGVYAVSGRGLYTLDAASGVPRWCVPIESGSTSVAAVAGSTVFIGSGIGQFLALDAASGAELWRRDFGTVYVSDPVVTGDVVYVTTNDGVLHALDAATGVDRWQFVGEVLDAAPAVGDDTVYVTGGGDDPAAHALDAATGAVRWRFAPGTGMEGSPTLAGELVIISANQALYALDAVSGHEVWHVPVDYLLASAPTVADGVIYVGGWDGTIYAVG